MSKNVTRESWLILILLSIIWGSSFILIKKTLIAFSAPQAASLRLVISFLAFTPIVLLYRQKIEWSKWKTFLIVGLTGSGIPAFLFSTAQTQISSLVAGLLNSLTPIWTLILGIMLFNRAHNRYQHFGILLGFIGAGTMIVFGNEVTLGGFKVFTFLVILATLCYGFSVNLVQSKLSGMRPIIISGFSFFLIGPPALVYLLNTNFVDIVQSHPHALKSLMSVTTLSLLGTVLSSILFYDLVQKTNAVFGSTVTYMMPVVAIGWGLIDGEAIGFIQILAFLFIVAGVFLTKKGIKS